MILKFNVVSYSTMVTKILCWSHSWNHSIVHIYQKFRTQEFWHYNSTEIHTATLILLWSFCSVRCVWKAVQMQQTSWVQYWISSVSKHRVNIWEHAYIPKICIPHMKIVWEQCCNCRYLRLISRKLRSCSKLQIIDSTTSFITLGQRAFVIEEN